MTMLINAWRIGPKVSVCEDTKLNVKLNRPALQRMIELHPATADEPLFRSFRVIRLSVKDQKSHYHANTGEVVVTVKRVLLLLRGAYVGKEAGTAIYTVISLDRDEFRVLGTATDRKKQVTEVQLSTDSGASISVSTREPPESLLEMLAPESAERLGPEAAAVRRQARQEEEQKRLEAERKVHEEKMENAAREFQAAQAANSPPGPVHLSVGGLLDHRRTWRYRVAAPESECIRAFVNAFSAGGGVLLRSKWKVQPGPTGAVAVYEGRKGILAATTLLSETATAEQGGALGSEVKFEVLGRDGEHTICEMWLASRASRVGFTNDARFFRPYMRAVEVELRRLDPSTQVAKE
jgi:hypothetical protein